MYTQILPINFNIKRNINQPHDKNKEDESLNENIKISNKMLFLVIQKLRGRKTVAISTLPGVN